MRQRRSPILVMLLFFACGESLAIGYEEDALPPVAEPHDDDDDDDDDGDGDESVALECTVDVECFGATCTCVGGRHDGEICDGRLTTGATSCLVMCTCP